MKITSIDQCKTGMKVMCAIRGTEIKDAVLHVGARCGKPFVWVCQNLESGDLAPDFHGYKYSYGLYGLSGEGVDCCTGLESVEDAKPAKPVASVPVHHGYLWDGVVYAEGTIGSQSLTGLKAEIADARARLKLLQLQRKRYGILEKRGLK